MFVYILITQSLKIEIRSAMLLKFAMKEAKDHSEDFPTY
ncbi:MAG: hypothetical protein K0R36_867 [Chryseobacterium sp.]|jgi:hypothetical protein|nr:hypothetical protein [Chryseobacterium sp.]